MNVYCRSTTAAKFKTQLIGPQSPTDINHFNMYVVDCKYFAYALCLCHHKTNNESIVFPSAVCSLCRYVCTCIILL